METAVAPGVGVGLLGARLLVLCGLVLAENLGGIVHDDAAEGPVCNTRISEQLIHRNERCQTLVRHAAALGVLMVEREKVLLTVDGMRGVVGSHRTSMQAIVVAAVTEIQTEPMTVGWCPDTGVLGGEILKGGVLVDSHCSLNSFLIRRIRASSAAVGGIPGSFLL